MPCRTSLLPYPADNVPDELLPPIEGSSVRLRVNYRLSALRQIPKTETSPSLFAVLQAVSATTPCLDMYKKERHCLLNVIRLHLFLWAVYTGNPEIPYPDDAIALSWKYPYNVASWLLSPSQPAASLRTRHKAEMLNYSSHESLTFCEDYTTDILSA